MIKKTNQQKLVFAWGVVLLVVRTTNLLSLFVEWVKLFTDKVTRGGRGVGCGAFGGENHQPVEPFCGVG
ncbi:hypothetical protein [Escherichia coli]|uniref:hypothetical protein n=1 Tax=Escherichia coli TaxID=562 RepID=UPI003D76AFCC